MDAIGKGIIAGFIAMMALSLALDPIVVLTRMMWAPSSALGWHLHFFVGSMLWGAGFAALHDHMWGASWVRGVTFAIGAWLAVMIIVMPMTSAGLFGLAQGPAAAMATLVVHVVYGAMLGAVFGALRNDRAPKPTADHGLRPLAH